jgi:predicted Zn-dependent protease
MKFNEYYFRTATDGRKLKTATHELGHALGLDHTSGNKDVMRQGAFEIDSLSRTDKKSYTEAYKTY